MTETEPGSPVALQTSLPLRSDRTASQFKLFTLLINCGQGTGQFASENGNFGSKSKLKYFSALASGERNKI